MRITTTAKAVLERFAEALREKKLPRAIKEVAFPEFDAPCARWSINNRMILAFNGTMDARGIRQWNQVGRRVKKGARAIYILAPLQTTITEYNEETGEEIIKTVITGFRAVPVFRVEDTEGRALEYQKIRLPKLPLMDVAKRWGIPVKAVPSTGLFLGCYTHSDKHKEIKLASPEEKVFFHELAHASQDRLGMLKTGNKRWTEITAELSALVLAELCGLDTRKVNSGATYEYIKMYSKKKDDVSIGRLVLKAVKDVDAIVMNIAREAGMRAVQVPAA